MIETVKIEDEYVDLWKENLQRISAPCPDVLNAPREEAAEKFSRVGFPDTSFENYEIRISNVFLSMNTALILPREMNLGSTCMMYSNVMCRT